MILEIMNSLCDKTRLRILSILYHKDAPMCVGDVELALELSQPNASRHLKRLLSDELVIATRKTQFIYYELNISTMKKYSFLSDLYRNNIIEMKECGEDIKRFSNIKPNQCIKNT